MAWGAIIKAIGTIGKAAGKVGKGLKAAQEFGSATGSARGSTGKGLNLQQRMHPGKVDRGFYGHMQLPGGKKDKSGWAKL
jgi:hypothetical protein